MSQKNNDDLPEIIKLFLGTLEKQTAQMATLASQVEEIKNVTNEIEHKFQNGFKSEIMGHMSKEVDNIASKLNEIDLEKISKGLTLVITNKEALERLEASNKGIGERLVDLKTNIKIDRAINITGWISLISTVLLTMLKLFGKI